jgi:hypothetical protein
VKLPALKIRENLSRFSTWIVTFCSCLVNMCKIITVLYSFYFCLFMFFGKCASILYHRVLPVQ